MTQGLLYNKDIQNRKVVNNMSQKFINVAGHIEVYSTEGEFLFSADTMEEAWRELCA